MGKRKERRLAAMMAASRRVKLDLCTEPSGEMVGSSLHDEVGGDLDKDHHAGVPSSPSSSASRCGGQKQENPLSLLEQYSDDELDEEAGKQPTQENEESLSTDPEGQVQENVDVGVVVGSKTDDADAIDDIKNDYQLDNISNLTSNDTKESDVAIASTEYTEADQGSQPIHDASRMQIVGDLPGSWKIVMHEQSNQYYYWNIVTGETSWEVPHGLTPEVQPNGVNISSTVEGQANYPIVLQANIPASDMHGISNLVPGSIETYGVVDMSKGDGIIQSSNTLLDYSRSMGEALSSYGVKHDTRTSGCYAMTDDQSDQLVQYGQNLLQRLDALKGCLDGHEWIIKEIEFRISDCKALSSYGSSLLPFWWHTQTMLKRLESVITRAESSSTAEKVDLGNRAASEVVEKKTTLAICEIADVQTEHDKQMLERDIENKETLSNSISNAVGNEKDEETVHSISKVELPTEDVDMDVEMEVDDEPVAAHTCTPHSTAEYPAPVESIIQTNASSVPSLAIPLGEPDIPPPPDEEWIPPPPPESELIPPPPPEDHPEPSYPPPHPEAMPPPFQDQYSLGYALPSYGYYPATGSEMTSVTYYVQATGSQIAEPPQPSYYEPIVSSAYAEVATHVNPVEPMAYYNISGGSVSHAPVVSGTGSSGFYVESGPVSYTNSSSVLDHASSVVYNVESANSSLHPPKQDSDVSAVVKEPDKVNLEAGSNLSTKQLSNTALSNGSTTVAPASNKNKPKVLRSKKVTVAVASLRSNKKVSSLVDKWKAAKEELHGEEEEPEDALEILEKKRQKEIEEWHARQIATGEAEDNVNFLPLGGDWRERVKRRRAEAKTDTTSETVSDTVENEKKQPDLTELSKDLPPAWQAYWDESSKEVYYGNSITSETTWIRPSR